MIGQQLGPYSIKSELGSGGMGKVYLAEVLEPVAGLEPGSKIALKVVHPFLLETPGFFKRFMQEAELGKRIRHQNVVRTFDVDAITHEGQHYHYMVMEYVEGRSLRELLLDLGKIPETLLREIALQTAAGLAAIHETGIVHRDLKPENILITDDEEVRIMDLGVAKLQEVSIAMTKEGQFAGSLLYAAPEQFNKDEVGPPADMYSLGVLLYELATGQNPFRADDAASVIQAHLQVDPPRAGEVNPDVSLFLSEIINALIAKSPADRVQSGGDLHKLLEEGERSPWWIERAQRLHAQRSHLPRIQVPRDTAIHGRDDDVNKLGELWERAKQGHGSTILFEGEAGIGKTRLVDTFVRSLEEEDCHVLYGSYPPSGGMGGFSDAIIDKFGEAGLAQALRPYLTITPTLVPSFAALVKHEPPPTGAEHITGEAVATVSCHLMRGLAEEKPTVWILDDLHFAPQESRHLVLAMARAVAPERALIVVTSRPGLPEDELAHFTRLPNFHRKQLSRLGAREVMEVLRAAFKSGMLAEKLGGKIAYKSDGVPFFIFEMIRGLKEGRFIIQEADGKYVQSQVISDIEVPSAVKDLIEGRMRGLTESQRAILDVGAVMGISFEPGLVATVIEEKKVKVLRELADVERKLGLVRGEAGTCRFDQNQIQEVLYQSLMPDLRAEYHMLLAETRATGDPYFLAYHHLKGSNPEAAEPFLKPALEHLAAAYQNERWIELADLALDAKGLLPEQERCRLLISKGSRHGTLGQRKEEGETLREAVALADELGDYTLRCSARRHLGWHFNNLARADEAERVLEEALAIAHEANDDTEATLISGRLSAVADTLGYYEKGLGLWERAKIPIGAGLSQQYLGRYADAQESFERGIEESRERKSRVLEGIGLVNLGRLQAVLGDPDTGRKTLEEAKTMLRATGQRRPEGYALHRLGVVAEQLGEIDEAKHLYGQALALRREIVYPGGIAETAIELGRLSNSRDLLEEAHRIGCETKLAGEIVLSAVYLGEGGAEALQEHGDRMRVMEKARANFALWEATKKPEYLEEAHQLHNHLLENSPESCRDAMIENVALHRDIMEAWKEHGAKG